MRTSCVRRWRRHRPQTSGRSDFEQKIGDYWQACSDEPALEAAGNRDLKPGLERIAKMKSKSELADQVAQIHLTVPGAWSGNDNQTGSSAAGIRIATGLRRCQQSGGGHRPGRTGIAEP